MFSRSAFSVVVLSLALVALAEVTPTDPSPGQVFKPGAACSIAWNADTTGTWKTLNIELMTGDNLNMVHLTTVATVDGTTSPGTFSYPCPAVTIPAPIYFYQFSTPASSTKTWTGRFTISDASGQTVPAPNQVQPNGQAIPWGTGALADPSKAVPAPAGGNTTSTGTSTNGTSASPLANTGPTAVASSGSSSPSKSPLDASQSGFASQSASGVAAAASASASNTTTSSNSGGALVLGTVSTRAARAGVALAIIAGTFTFLV